MSLIIGIVVGVVVLVIIIVIRHKKNNNTDNTEGQEEMNFETAVSENISVNDTNSPNEFDNPLFVNMNDPFEADCNEEI